jgi:Double zinc ribbon
MLCTFCGTENRLEHKFCGMCGVRLERRQAERRVHPSGVSLKCSGCSHLNDPGLKFCGMCGTRIERRVQDRRSGANEPRAGAIANAQLPSPDVAGRARAQVAAPPAAVEEIPVPLPRRGEPAIFRNEQGRGEPVRNEPENGGHISGPSFLGLNSPPEGDTDYLLEDEPSRGGLRKLVLLAILAAILGLVFVQWRSSFKANPKPAPVKTEPSPTPASAPQGDNQPQGSGATAQPPQDASKAKATNTDTGASDAGVPDGGSKDQKTQPAAAASASASSSVTPAAAAEVPAGKSTASDEDAQPGSDSKATEEARLPDYKPSSALVRAQQYLRGRGVQQNCEQGLLYLRAATEKNDPGAAIQMAALYSSGHCVKQDRVMAYRWFNSAHELQPANMWIQKNMDQLWAQMTSQERRLAGY